MVVEDRERSKEEENLAKYFGIDSRMVDPETKISNLHGTVVEVR